MDLIEYFLGWARAEKWDIVDDVLEETASTERDTFVSPGELSLLTTLMRKNLGAPRFRVLRR